MNFDEFKNKVLNLPIINVQNLKLENIFDHSLKIQLLRWQKAKKVIRLRKNYYILGPADRKINPSRFYIACQIYPPSYISLETALSIYGIIPEKVSDITSISTKKTVDFYNNIGNFLYQHIKQDCFTGFRELRDEANLPYFMAFPEKAVIDFIYLNLHRFEDDYQGMLKESFRFQNLDALSCLKLTQYASLYGNKKLMAVNRALKKLVEEL